jgi:DNA (cytosine-5)-methyltransferase 1
MTALRYYEFFAGAGLVRLALNPPWTCVWANDNDPRKAAVYTANLGGDHFDSRDVAQVKAEDLPSGVDMAWASFPCQDLSLAGWQGGMSAERSGAFWAFWRIMRDLLDRGDRPPLLVIENVTGLLYGDNFAGLCEALAALGMQFGPLVIDARHFLPQSRPRVFVVAADSRVDCKTFVAALPKGLPWFPPAVWAARAALPQSLADLWRWWRLPLPSEAVPSILELIEDEPAGVEWHTKEETERLLQLMSPVNREKVRQARSERERVVGLLYKRTRSNGQRAEVRFDGIAGCLRTPRGGSSRQTVLVVDGGRVRSRLLSPREAARLMGVPDSYRLPLNYNDAYLAMGDGVAVPVVAWLADHLLTPLAKTCRASGNAVRGEFDAETNGRLASSRKIAETLAARWGALQT